MQLSAFQIQISAIKSYCHSWSIWERERGRERERGIKMIGRIWFSVIVGTRPIWTWCFLFIFFLFNKNSQRLTNVLIWFLFRLDVRKRLSESHYVNISVLIKLFHISVIPSNILSILFMNFNRHKIGCFSTINRRTEKQVIVSHFYYIILGANLGSLFSRRRFCDGYKSNSQPTAPKGRKKK